jgi:branched-chain amino acid transport system substrate-binding protein
MLAMPALVSAAIPGNLLRIGVLTDMSGPFRDQVGPGSVAAAELAAEDFAAEARGIRVEILAADHQNRPDVGLAQARRWVDEGNVHAIVDLPNSAIGLAVSGLMREKGRTALASSTATSDLTGSACSPNTVQWVNDTWSQANGTARGVLRQGGDAWFFLTVDYALGHALERDATAAVLAQGGRVAGASRHPLGTAGYASPLVRARASGANVVALASTGTDAINAVKQAREFGLIRDRRMRLAALFVMVSDIDSMGLEVAQDLLVTEAFYWDLDDRRRAWAQRWAGRMPGRMPTMDHAGVYSATLAWLRAARDAGSIEGAATVARMKEVGWMEDPLFGPTRVREDGRTIHPMHVFRVKAPAASRGRWDLYDLVETIPAENAFRPLADGGCALVRSP